MSVLLARYEVADVDRFLAVFDGFERSRGEHGSTGHWVFRRSEWPACVIVLISFDSREQAEGFAASPERDAALREAGVTGREDEILEIVRSSSS
jgi:hypothetical protein